MAVPYLKQHDIIVKHPVAVLWVFNDQGDVEYLLQSIPLGETVLTQDHFNRVTPTRGEDMNNCSADQRHTKVVEIFKKE